MVVHAQSVKRFEPYHVASLQVVYVHGFCQLLAELALFAKNDVVFRASDEGIEVVRVAMLVCDSSPIQIYASLQLHIAHWVSQRDMEIVLIGCAKLKLPNRSFWHSAKHLQIQHIRYLFLVLR